MCGADSLHRNDRIVRVAGRKLVDLRIVGPDVVGWLGFVGGIRAAVCLMVVDRRVAGGQSNALQPAGLSQTIVAQPRALSHVYWDTAAQVWQVERGGPIATIGGSDERKQRSVLRDGKGRPVAQRPACRSVVATKHPDFAEERFGHA